MKVETVNLELLDSFPEYLEGDEVDRFFDTFQIKFAAGHWCAGDFVDRFASQGYSLVNSSDIIAQMERVAKAGIQGIEFHNTLFLDEDYHLNENTLERIKKALKEFSLTPTNMNMNFFTDPLWKYGGITNPDRKLREKAINIALEAVEIAREVGCGSVALWPGSDGWDYNFEANYIQRFSDFLDGCIKINQKAEERELRFGIEAKLHEPREGNMIIPTTHLAGLIVKEVNKRCGSDNMGVAIDYGHEQMYAVDPGATLYAMKVLEIPVVNFHINTAKTHSNDEDRITGTGDIWKMTEFCYAAIDTGYDGWFGEDQFTYRTDPVVAMRLSKEIFANLMKKALRIYSMKKQLQSAQSTGDSGKTLEAVKKIILTG